MLPTKRLRLIEESKGRGVLRAADGSRATETDYHLAVEVEQRRAGREWVDGLRINQARVTLDQAFVFAAVMDGLPLVLELQDGRQFDCWMTGDGLLIARTGDALHDPADSVASHSPRPHLR